MTHLRAFHGDATVQQKYLDRVRAHYAAAYAARSAWWLSARDKLLELMRDAPVPAGAQP